MKQLFTLAIITFFSVNGISQVPYKEMMKDPSYNFYEVVNAAELYFQTHPKGKGSGWKPYQRWKFLNESKYYPSGDRSQVDPYLIENAFENIKGQQLQTKSFYGSGWRDLGPYSVDSITGHYSAGMGRVEHFYINPSNTQQMYLGSRSGGFWRTVDGGITWNNTTDFLVSSGVDAIAVSPTNPDSVLINVKNARNSTTHGVYRSVDGGITWTQTNFNPTNLGWGGLGSSGKIFAIAYHPTIPDLVFIGTNSGIYRSDDNLATWTQHISTGDIIDIDFHPTNDNIIYIYDDYYWGANQNVVLKSTDLGLSYTASNTISGNSDAKAHVDVSPDCPSCVYFASTNGVWKSIDEGVNFTFLTNPSQSCDGFAVNDLDTSKMIYGYLDLLGSNDGGQTFNQIAYWSQGTAASFNNGLYIHADLRYAKCINGTYYVATDGFLSKSDNNGATWQILSQGTGIRENYSLGVSQSNHFRSIAGSQDNGTSIKHETTWLEFYGADGMEGIIHPLNHDWMMGSVQNGIRRRTKDGGSSQGGVTPAGQSGSWIAPLIYDPNDHMVVYSFGENIYRSSDFGSGWTNIGTPNFTGTIAEAAIAQNNSNIIIASKGSNIEKSVDGGVTFTDISNNLPNYTITDIAFAPHDDNIILVTFARFQDDGQKIYKSIDQGQTWTNITFNLNAMPLRKAVIDHLPDHNIYVGAEIGVYTMPLNGTTWALYNTDLPNMAIEDMEVMWGTNTVRAATWGRGLWEYTLVGRSDYPAIIKTNITDTPDDQVPMAYVDQYVTSVISYDHTITNAYVKWSTNNQSFNNTITMSNTIDSTWVSDSPIPGAGVNSKTYFKVFAVGSSGDTTETYKFMYTSKPSCISFGNMSWATAVTLVDFENINNPTGKTQPYTNYYPTDSADLILGNSYDLTVNLNTDGNYTIYAKAWIDWNQNGLYTDFGEEYDLGFTQNSIDGITSSSPLSITAPSTALLGSTTMRVSAKFGSIPTSCETGFDGEVEDYKINIHEPEIYYAITNTPICVNDFINFSYIGSDLDSISWSISNGTTSYNSTNFNDNVIFTDSGSFTLNINGYLYGQTYIVNTPNIFYISPVDSISINSTICQGESYLLGGQVLTTTGIYSETFQTATCDSIVTVDLTVNSVDATVTSQDFTLSATLVGASYQWVDCEDNWSPISGATNQTYTSNSNGEFAVIITDQTCIDTSDCYTISGLDIFDSSNSFEVKVYPNPVKDNLTISLPQVYGEILIEIYDEIGNIVYQNTVADLQVIQLDLSAQASGIYYVNVTVDKKFKTVELIKI